MMGRLRDGFLNLCDEISCRLRALSAPRRRVKQPVVKGNMQSMLVMRPEGGIFREVIFILRDEYLQQGGVSRQELLRQAREAAGEYMRDYIPEKKPPTFLLWPALALCAAALLILL